LSIKFLSNFSEIQINTLNGLLLIIAFSVFLAILPERVLGSLSITTACLKLATGPIEFLTCE